MLGALVSNICGKFGAVGSAVRFDLGRIFGAEAGGSIRMNFFYGFSFFDDLSLFFCVFFFEDRAANDRIGFRFRRGFLALGFHEVGRQSGDLIVVQIRAVTRGLTLRSDRSLWRVGFLNHGFGCCFCSPFGPSFS